MLGPLIRPAGCDAINSTFVPDIVAGTRQATTTGGTTTTLATAWNKDCNTRRPNRPTNMLPRRQVLVWPYHHHHHHHHHREIHSRMPCTMQETFVTWTEPGYVLGWKSFHAQMDRQTVVCAGVLSLNRSLEDYRHVISNLKRRQQQQQQQQQQSVTQQKESPGRNNSCRCLLENLDIIAYWDPNFHNQANHNYSHKHIETQTDNSQQEAATTFKAALVNSNTNSYRVMGLIRIIPRQQGNYPWWQDGPETNTIAKQLVFYNFDCVGPYQHSSSTSSTSSSSDWSRILHRMNNAKQVFLMVVHGCNNIPTGLPTSNKSVNDDFCGTCSPTNSNIKSSLDQTDPPQSQPQRHLRLSPLRGWQRIQHFLVTQSFTVLHWNQICRRGSVRHKPTTDLQDNRIQWDLFTAFSLVRFLRAVQHRPTYSTTSSNQRRSIPCSVCGKPSIVPSSQYKCMQDQMAYWNDVIPALLDLVLGIVVGSIALSLSSNEVTSLFYIQTKGTFLSIFQQDVAWLERFPVGFKLNVSLTQNMGHEIQNLIHFHQALLQSTLGNPSFVQASLLPCLGTVGIVFGWTTMLTLIVDVWKIEIIPMTLLAIGFRVLYKAEWYLLAALWRLFRGKKRNVLRQRTDTMEYDAMQLLLGTIGFCICIFLWTTLLVYYTFFTAWNVMIQVPMMVIWSIYVMSRITMWGNLFWRTAQPDAFIKSLYLEAVILDHDNDGNNDWEDEIQVTQFVTVSETYSSIVWESLGSHVKKLFKWWFAFAMQVLFPQDGTTSPYSIPFASLLQTFHETSPNQAANNDRKINQ